MYHDLFERREIGISTKRGWRRKKEKNKERKKEIERICLWYVQLMINSNHDFLYTDWSLTFSSLFLSFSFFAFVMTSPSIYIQSWIRWMREMKQRERKKKREKREEAFSLSLSITLITICINPFHGHFWVQIVSLFAIPFQHFMEMNQERERKGEVRRERERERENERESGGEKDCPKNYGTKKKTGWNNQVANPSSFRSLIIFLPL